jgi:hypothetical protein
MDTCHESKLGAHEYRPQRHHELDLIISRVGPASDQVAQNPKKLVGSSLTMGVARQKTHKFRSQAKVGQQSQCNGQTT